MYSVGKILRELDGITVKSDLSDGNSARALPDTEKICGIINDTLSLLFPGYFGAADGGTREAVAERAVSCLSEQIDAVFDSEKRLSGRCGVETAWKFLEKLPKLKEILLTDIEALYNGDPAAKNREEVLICYPGFFAVAVYRIAHELFLMGVPVIPRIMTEYAHGKTGIDIHPGAEIGDHFFIDHGTGIVIGETTVIGSNVKLYQGVTLGARSFEHDKDGNPVKNLKRHPNIGNNVIIYANATILGGNTFIGDNCIIGASTWIVQSVPENSTVLYSSNTEKILQLWGDNGSGI
ncbi:MAG: serine acetyltransferase [Clostridia bacterium]|nr:serine acetyltransferase [Clostridia bacterium]